VYFDSKKRRTAERPGNGAGGAGWGERQIGEQADLQLGKVGRRVLFPPSLMRARSERRELGGRRKPGVAVTQKIPSTVGGGGVREKSASKESSKIARERVELTWRYRLVLETAILKHKLRTNVCCRERISHQWHKVKGTEKDQNSKKLERGKIYFYKGVRKKTTSRLDAVSKCGCQERYG